MIHLVPLVLYAGAFGFWVRELVRGASVRSAPLASGVTGGAVLAHAIALGEFWLRHGELPLVGPGAALSTLAFTGGLLLLATLPLREAARVAIGLLPFIIVVQGAALLIGIQPSPEAIAFQGTGFVLHVALAFLGYQGLAVASAAGVLYLIQHHELKTKRLGRFFSFLPPLTTLDRLGRVGIWIGFTSLSVALALAWVWTTQVRGSLEIRDPKVLWAILSWVVFGAVLLARLGGGRSDYRGAVASVAGFSLVILTYLVLRLTVGGAGFFL